jgi:hypothetical protein
MVVHREYVPKRNDCVLVKGKPNSYVVLVVRTATRTVDLCTSIPPVILYYNVPWTSLSYLSEEVPVLH